MLDNFVKGDKVVYPKHGVGFVENVNSVEFQSNQFEALNIVLKATGVKISIPVDKAREMGLRHVNCENGVDNVLKVFCSREEHPALESTINWKDRKKILADLFATGELYDLAHIVKYLFEKNQQKLLPNSERRIYDFSLKFLVHEMAEIKGIAEEDAEDLIANTLTINIEHSQ